MTDLGTPPSPAAARAARGGSPGRLRRWWRGAPRWWSHLLPSSLFGRLVVVLGLGLLVAQLLSAAINLAERDRLLLTSGGMQQAQRITDAVHLLDGLKRAERERVVAVLSAPPLVLSLHDAPGTPATDGGGARARMVQAMLAASLGPGRRVQVEVLAPAEAAASTAPEPGFGPGHMGRGPGMMGGGPGMGGTGPGTMGAGRGMMGGGPGYGRAWAGAGPALRTQVQLLDGSWARFDTALPRPDDSLPWRLGLSLLVLLAAVLGLATVAVRWVTRPLLVLATAADELGHDLHRPPLPEDGPREIRQAARAFNTMQQRLNRFVEDRTRILAAMSHDLKTPITRMRLRAELLDDESLRERFEADLLEMQQMVQHTLDFMRGLGGSEPARAVDLAGLLDGLRADHEAMGRRVTVEATTVRPVKAVPSLLKRALGNLVDNAVQYGGRATVRVEDHPDRVLIQVLDEGPGLAEADLERVFEPFYRVEASRSRATGGTGLGLTIARNIAQTHGGDIVLRNRPEGGLAAVLTLPRGA